MSKIVDIQFNKTRASNDKQNLIKSFDYLIVINPYANISHKHLNISMQMVFGR